MCVCVCVVGGDQDVITIQKSTMTPLSATVSRVSTGVGGWGSGYECISLSQRVLGERSGSVLDSRPRGRKFEPHRRHCVMVLEQDTFILA